MSSMSPANAFLGGYGAMSSPTPARPQAIQQSTLSLLWNTSSTTSWNPNMMTDVAIGFQYKYSPFYEMRVRIGEVKTLEGLYFR